MSNEDICFFSLLSGVGLLIGTAIFADKSVTKYYVATLDTSYSCVYGQSNWSDDTKAFCSTDIDKVLEVNERLNKSLEK